MTTNNIKFLKLVPVHWLNWLENNWTSMSQEQLRVGLHRMVIYSDKHGLYYLKDGVKKPFSEKIVEFVRDRCSTFRPKV